MTPRELSTFVELIAGSAKVLSKQSTSLLAEVEKYQRERDQAESEASLARAELAELQEQIDKQDECSEEFLRADIESLESALEDEKKELEAREHRIAELLELVSDLAELAHAVHPAEVEYRLLRENLGDAAARLRVGMQVRQARLPFLKASNG